MEELPEKPLDLLMMAKGLMLHAATKWNGNNDDSELVYRRVRRELLDNPEISGLLPDLVSNFRDLSGLRAHLQGKSVNWEGGERSLKLHSGQSSIISKA